MKVKPLNDSIGMGWVVAARGSVLKLATFNPRELLAPAPYAIQVASVHSLRRQPLSEESAENHAAVVPFSGSEYFGNAFARQRDSSTLNCCEE